MIILNNPIFPQELFESSKTVLGCIPLPKFRVIHRSLLFEAIQERKRSLLTTLLQALTATGETTTKQDKEMDDEKEKVPITEDQNSVSEKVFQILTVLEKLEQAHEKHNEVLIEANKDIKSSGVTKVSKMEDKIRSVKETLGTKNKMDLHLLDQPNAEGNTLLGLTTSMDDDEATEMLLSHGANPNVQDADGNSPLHAICLQKDIQIAKCILKNNGRLLPNKKLQTPAIEELFFDQEAQDVKELMTTIAKSQHKHEILDKILRKRHILFRLVEDDKSEVLSIVLEKLTASEQEEYVNLIRDEVDGNTALHLSTLSHRSLNCTSTLLQAGAKLKTNEAGLTPKIEDFFTANNEAQITTALVDGLVERVRANQLDKKEAIKLLIPNGKGRRTLFQLAKRSHWKSIREWANEHGIEFSDIVPRMAADDLETMADAAKEGFWEKEEVHALLCVEDIERTVLFSRLGFGTQKEIASWNPKGTNQIAHKMSTDFIRWLVQESKEGNWDGEELGAALCQLDSDNKLRLATVADEELQKQLAALNKTKTCNSVPLLGGDLQEWMYQEAMEGRWNQEAVFGVLERQETARGPVVSSRVQNLGMYPVYSHK